MRMKRIGTKKWVSVEESVDSSWNCLFYLALYLNLTKRRGLGGQIKKAGKIFFTLGFRDMLTVWANMSVLYWGGSKLIM